MLVSRVGCCHWRGKQGGINTYRFSMNGRGAVELIIASIGIELGLVNDVCFAIVGVVTGTPLLPPLVVMGALLNRHGEGCLRKLERATLICSGGVFL